jgi:hypothetical protein
MNLEDITEGEFRAYEEVRKSGISNMFYPDARILTGLDRDTYLGVMKYYTELSEKFPGVRK